MGRDPFPHLPPGREPGPQSLRSRASRGFWVPVVAVVGAAMTGAGIFVAAGGRGPRFDPQEELWGGIVFALGGILCLFGAWKMRGKGQLRRSRRLRSTGLAVAGDDVRRGDRISVTVTPGNGTRGSLEVGVVCVERYDIRVPMTVRGVTRFRRDTVEGAVFERWQPVGAPGSASTLTFEIPREAPYSYEGDCVSYAWRVSARAVRRMARDDRLDRAIWVRP